VWAVGAGLDDSGLISRRTVRRSLGLAVAGSVLLIAGLSIWVISAVGQVVTGTTAGASRLAGLGLMAAGAVCGLLMVVILLARERVPRATDQPPAAGGPGDAPELATAAPPRAESMAPDVSRLPERVPLAGLPPSRPAAVRAPEWPPPPTSGPRHALDPGNVSSPGRAAQAPLAAEAAWDAAQPAAEEAQPAAEEVQPDRAWARPPAKPTVGWNPDSPEDWLRVLRGLRGSGESPDDRHISHED
jgi:hypothetical protein